ncbi:MAG: F0F1 ATP synthase subunit gamma [Chloroflexi bacterium]|nr:F0F1 ATP synthase subunit gamma [Chloroflexota bacterium]
MEDIERIQQRLENIKGIEPILTALRTIAVATWRVALRRLEAAREYTRQLEEVLAIVVPHLPPSDSRQGKPAAGEALLVIAAERGLCGGFNRAVLEAAEGFIAEQRAQGQILHLLTLGERARRHFQRLGEPILRAERLPTTALWPFAQAQALAEWAMDAHGARQIDGLQVLYNRYLSAVAYEPVTRRLIPPPMAVGTSGQEAWLPTIVETDAAQLHALVMTQLVIVGLYLTVIESAASEQAARFRVMDGASQNSQRLIEELTLEYHQARQQAITREMLDLTAGAGLLPGIREEDTDR